VDGKIRVIVVDDTIIVRRLVSDVLNSDPEIEVVGVAANGQIALDKVRQLEPDLVTLDVEMPVMDGIEALMHLRREHPYLPIIMFSTTTQRGAAKTLEALSLGASDYVTKPSQTGSLEASLERVREELLPKVKSLAESARNSARARLLSAPTREAGSGSSLGAASPLADVCTPSGGARSLERREVVVPTRVAPAPERARSHEDAVARAIPIDVIAIAVSTGGPNALNEVIPALPASLNVPVLIVQHMPPMFTQMLAQRLDSASPLKVEEGREGAPIEPGRIYLAPGGRHMEVQRVAGGYAVHLTDDPEENSCRPAADVLMRSVAEHYGPRSLGVVLTGMGQDGLRGCEAIAKAGGSVFAQDEASSVVWGMPGAVVAAGIASRVVSLQDMAGHIYRRAIGGGSEARGSEARGSEPRDSETRGSETRDSETRDSETRDSELRDSELRGSETRASGASDSEVGGSEGALAAARRAGKPC